jgi:hypothetical protein
MNWLDEGWAARGPMRVACEAAASAGMSNLGGAARCDNRSDRTEAGRQINAASAESKSRRTGISEEWRSQGIFILFLASETAVGRHMDSLQARPPDRLGQSTDERDGRR